MKVAEIVADLVDGMRLPVPGAGRTFERLCGLASVSSRSLSAGRIFEGHADAIAILAEAGCPAPPGLLAVWASEDPVDPVELVESDEPVLTIMGTKRFCSAATMASTSLVTARSDQGGELALVPLRGPGVQVADSEWANAGMGDADTRTVRFAQAPVRELVGPPNWYLTRPGFWHGAVGVAACWYGGAFGLVTTMRAAITDRDSHGLALLGEAEAECFAMRACLAVAAREIDDAPRDIDAARRRALLVRTAVERGCRAVLDLAALALGPRSLALDADHAQRVADLGVYLRQHHGRRDHEQLGRAMIDVPESSC